MNYVSTRQFTRVNFQRNVQLDFGGKKYSKQIINDLSLSGMYVKGEFDQKTGDTCTIELSKPEDDSGVELRACCSVVRVNDKGMALEFISMRHDSFLFLQTTLLYEADDPLLLGTEFVKNVTFTVESDEE
ncbi:MAG: PilZ domain-containing protein [Candidatus Electrothrix sp. AR4]|nr:PilZ domain-containing protein [Candidatus Electrothrix sp. AR4]